MKKKNLRVSVVIPSFNESKTIRKVVTTVMKAKNVDEIIVIDDGSTDETANQIRDLDVKVVRHQVNLGKGAAMKTGLKQSSGSIILFLDADLKNITSSKINALIKPVLEKKADFTKAKLRTKRGRLTKLLVIPLMKFLFPDMHFGEAISGLYCGRREFFEKINIEKDYGVDIGVLLDAFEHKLKIKEVNIGKILHKEKSLDDLKIIAEDVARTILEKSGAFKKKAIKLKKKLR